MNQGDQTNILRLYEELGVRPDQGVERLTERYRQRVRELHPDANPTHADGEHDGIGWMSRSYREALAFERLHGRLPGAGQAGGAVPSAGSTAGAAARRRRRPEPVTANPLWRWLVFIAALALLIGFMAPDLLSMVDPPGSRR